MKRIEGRHLSDIELRTRGHTLYQAIMMHKQPKEVTVISVDASGPVYIDVIDCVVNLKAYRFADGFIMYAGIDKKRKLLVINSLNTCWMEEIK